MCAAPALAQTCALPRNVQPVSAGEPDWSNRTARVGGYVLALSWSPEYCARSRGDPPRRDWHQCRDNSFGLVVHGLWPQGENARRREDHPRHCRVVGPLDVEVLRAHLCTVPGVRLMQHQWAAHGSCAFSTPQRYFGAIERLNAVIAKPALDALHPRSGEALTVGDVRRAFARANAAIGLDASAIGIDVTDRQRLREIRVCYDFRFRFARCDRPGAPDRVPIRIRPRP